MAYMENLHSLAYVVNVCLINSKGFDTKKNSTGGTQNDGSLKMKMHLLNWTFIGLVSPFCRKLNFIIICSSKCYESFLFFSFLLMLTRKKVELLRQCCVVTLMYKDCFETAQLFEQLAAMVNNTLYDQF